MLTMTLSGELTVDSFELHDEYRFNRDSTLLMQLVQHIPTGDSESDNDNNNTDNNDESLASALADGEEGGPPVVSAPDATTGGGG